MTTPRSTTSSLLKIAVSSATLMVLLRIRKQYGKRAFWLAYLAAGLNGLQGGWNDMERAFADLKTAIARQRAARAQVEAAHEALDKLTSGSQWLR